MYRNILPRIVMRREYWRGNFVEIFCRGVKLKFLVDEVEVALPYGTHLSMVIRHPARVLLRLCAPSTFHVERTT